jgi:predicted O-methyltransferase YrrM
METIKLGEVQFVLDHRSGPLRGKSEDNKFVLVKTRRHLSFYESLREWAPKHILEIGMFEGGSIVYFDKLYSPKTLVGVDIRRAPIPALERYKEGRPHIKTYYGRSQDKPPTRGAAQTNFPDGIDLVIDDASHLYAQTKAAFENIFPLVKPGGLYVIEDWGWAHHKNYQGENAVWSNQPALTNLIFELTVMTAISRVIDTVTITENLVSIKKGRGMLPVSKLDLSGNLRGKEMPLI